MNHFLKLLSGLCFILFVSCENPTETKNDNTFTYTTKGKPFGPASEVISSGSFNRKPTDTASMEVRILVDSGSIYNIDIKKNRKGFNVNNYVQLKHGKVSSDPSFTAAESDTLTLWFTCEEIYSQDISEYSFNYTIRKYGLLSGEFHGQWLRSEYKTTAFGDTSSLTFSEQWADEVIFITEDSINSYWFYKKETDQILNTEGFIVDSDFMDYNYTLDNDTLKFHTGNSWGSMEMTYVRTDVAPTDMEWREEWIEVPYEILGTWYHSDYMLKSMEIADGEIIVNNIDEYSIVSAEETDSIITVTNDSVIVYTPQNGMFTRESYPSTRFELIQKFSRVEDNLLIIEGTEFEGVSDIYAGIYKFKSTYKRYDGELEQQGM